MKLLNRSIRSYLIYSFIIILITIPLFYFFIQQIVYEEVDESLVAQKEEIVQNLEKLSGKPSTTGNFVLGIELIPLKKLPLQDSLYNIEVFDKISGEHLPYRVLESGTLIRNQPYAIRLRKSLIDNEDLVQSILLVMTLLLVLILVGFLVINRIISKKIWGPFYRTVNSLNTYEFASKDKIEFEETDIDEFKDLNNSISELIKRNLFVFQSQKEFTENAAHEMQTPLAILQGKLELLMQTHPFNAAQADLINDLSNAGRRMNRLNKSLVLLTKIENNQFIEKEKISVNDTVDRFVEQFAYLTEQKNIVVQNPSQPDITIEANKSLFEILISNLVSNAMRHTPDHGNIIIATLKNDVLTIRNTAKNGSLDHSRIFQRFQKDSPDYFSTGLGLAISEKICSLNQFNLQYHYTEGMHEFSVKF